MDPPTKPPPPTSFVKFASSATPNSYMSKSCQRKTPANRSNSILDFRVELLEPPPPPPNVYI